MKKHIEETEIPLPIFIPFDCSQPIAIKATTAGEMLFYYYPKATAKLLQKCLKRAKEDHKLELNKKYQAVFIKNE